MKSIISVVVIFLSLLELIVDFVTVSSKFLFKMLQMT